MTEPPPHMLAALRAEIAKRAPVPLVDQVFREATTFHEGAQRSFEQRAGPDGRIVFPVTAAIVNLAFASELYLKALYVLETGTTRQGHRLNVLFAGLSEAAQAEVRERYELRRDGISPDFTADLKSFANAFVEWRYVYELGDHAVDPIGLGQLASALYETCVALKPDLQTSDYTHRRFTDARQGVPIFAADRPA